MKVKYYKEDDILVIKMSTNPIDYAEESDWIIMHYDENKNPVTAATGWRTWIGSPS